MAQDILTLAVQEEWKVPFIEILNYIGLLQFRCVRWLLQQFGLSGKPS